VARLCGSQIVLVGKKKLLYCQTEGRELACEMSTLLQQPCTLSSQWGGGHAAWV